MKILFLFLPAVDSLYRLLQISPVQNAVATSTSMNFACVEISVLSLTPDSGLMLEELRKLVTDTRERHHGKSFNCSSAGGKIMRYEIQNG